MKSLADIVQAEDGRTAYLVKSSHVGIMTWPEIGRRQVGGAGGEGRAA